MRSLCQTSGMFAVALCLSLLLIPKLGFVQEKEKKELEGNSAAKTEPRPLDFETIRERLNKPIKLQFVETPLKDVVEYAANQAEVPIGFDVRSLEEEGVGLDTPVSRALVGIKAAVALRDLLENVNPTLDFAIRDGFVLISTRSKLDELYETRVYRFDQLPRLATAGMPATGYGGGEASGYPGGPPASNEMRSQKFREVLAVVEPNSWQENGGTARMAAINGHLVVWQTARIHEQIANLLEDLREAGDPDRPMPAEGMMGPGGMPGGGSPPVVPPPPRRRPLPRPAAPSTLENY